MVELVWRAATGLGELSLIDNLAMLHPSYYPERADKGYPFPSGICISWRELNSWITTP